jgi:hypothetical protein
MLLKILRLFFFFWLFYTQVTDCKAQNILSKKADSLFNDKKYEEAALLYENLLVNHKVNKPVTHLKLAYIYEKFADNPKTLFHLYNYYNLKPEDKVFEKMNKLAFDNNYEGYERSDVNFLLMLYKQFYNYIIILFLAIGVYIFTVLINKKIKFEYIATKQKIVTSLYLILLLLFINLPKAYSIGIVNNEKVYLRDNPTAAAKVLGVITKGNKLNVLGNEDIWLKILWKKKFYYVKESDVFVVNN